MFIFVIENITDCDTESMTLKSKAVQKDITSKPPTIWSQTIMIKALITNKNNPNEKIVKGKVKITINGLMKIFNNPNTIATKTDVIKLFTIIPGKNLEIIITKTAVIKILLNNFMFMILKMVWFPVKKRMDFLHATSAQLLELFLKWILENDGKCFAHHHLKYTRIAHLLKTECSH